MLFRVFLELGCICQVAADKRKKLAAKVILLKDGLIAKNSGRKKMNIFRRVIIFIWTTWNSEVWLNSIIWRLVVFDSCTCIITLSKFLQDFFEDLHQFF